MPPTIKHFVLGVAVGVSAIFAALGVPAVAGAATGSAYSFASEPNLHPPKVVANGAVHSKQLAPGYFLIASFKNATIPQPLVGQGGPLILDNHLQPVWFHPVGNLSATNLMTQSYGSRPVLSWWQGNITNTGAVLSGTDVVVDQHYKTVAQLSGKDGWVLSPHEFLISGHDAWVTAYKVIPMNLAPEGGPANGFLLDSAVQEYDLKTGKLLMTWDVKDHIALSQSKTHPAPIPTIAWDAYHVNSVELLSGGKFLTSMRNTWGAYLVDSKSGKIEWTLGAGANSTFKFGPNAQFEWQHDVQLLKNNQVSVFDDACCAIVGAGKFGPASGASRGLVLQLDTTAHTANVVRQYTHGSTFDAAFLGSMQVLSNGNAVVGWGAQPFFSEYSRSGTLLLDATLPAADVSYRAFVQSWSGSPSSPPTGAVQKRSGKTIVFASWNGATQVARWAVLAGSDSKHLQVVASGRRTGFETSLRLKHGYTTYEVRALDGRGHVLGTSHSFPKKQVVPPFCPYPPCPA